MFSNKKRFSIFFILFISVLLFQKKDAFSQDFHVSTFDVDYNFSEQRFHITVQILKEDAVKVLENIVSSDINLESQSNKNMILAAIGEYLSNANIIRVDGLHLGIEVADYSVIANLLVIKAKTSIIPKVKRFDFLSTFLMEHFPNQNNVVNVTYGENHSAFVLNSRQQEVKIKF